MKGKVLENYNAVLYRVEMESNKLHKCSVTAQSSACTQHPRGGYGTDNSELGY